MCACVCVTSIWCDKDVLLSFSRSFPYFFSMGPGVSHNCSSMQEIEGAAALFCWYGIALFLLSLLFTFSSYGCNFCWRPVPLHDSNAWRPYGRKQLWFYFSSTLRHDVANHPVFLMDGGKNILAEEVNTWRNILQNSVIQRTSGTALPACVYNILKCKY